MVEITQEQITALRKMVDLTLEWSKKVLQMLKDMWNVVRKKEENSMSKEKYKIVKKLGTDYECFFCYKHRVYHCRNNC